MDRIHNQRHPKEMYYYSISRMLERASYYGLRTLVVLYMVGETLEMEGTEALYIYGWLIGSLVFSQIIGALLGDLLIGNKKAVIIGGIIQAIGAFCLCIPSTIGLYAGLFLVVLGSGLYTPNMISSFGKLYLNKTKLLDSGFTLLYLAVNISAALGILFLGIIGEKYGYHYGFMLSGILILIAIVPFIIFKEEPQITASKSNLSLDKRILNIAIAFIAVGLFWAVYEVSSIRTYDLQTQFIENSVLDIPEIFWTSLNFYLIVPFSLIAIILWSYYYSSPFFKLMLGFISGAISFGILFLIPETADASHIYIYFISLFFLSIAEILIAPIIHSILTKYGNPKYLAILISLAFIPTRLFSLIFGLFNQRFYDSPTLGLVFGITLMTLFSIALVGFVIWNKKKNYDN
jgi:POT family proton-dependent oligopeptide transporter